MDLSRVKEELSLEKHSNELKMKHMVADLEQMAVVKEQAMHILDEKEAALRAIIKAFEDRRSQEEISKAKDAGKLVTPPQVTCMTNEGTYF